MTLFPASNDENQTKWCDAQHLWRTNSLFNYRYLLYHEYSQ